MKELPDWVQDELEKEANIEKNRQITTKYEIENFEAVSRLVNTIVKVIVKDISLDNFLKVLKNQFPDLDKEKIQSMALDIAQKRFWPLREWLGGTEKLIKDLGGELPKEGSEGWKEESKKTSASSGEQKLGSPEEEKERKEEAGSQEAPVEPEGDSTQSKQGRKEGAEPPKDLPSDERSEAKEGEKELAGALKVKKGTDEEREKEKKKKARLVKKPIKELKKEFPQVKDQPLSSNPLEVEEMEGEVRPTVKNWLKDYRYRMGAGYHDNMQRRSYLFRTKNGEKLDSTERKIISELLKSADEREPLPFDPETKKIVISELVSKEGKLSKKKKKPQSKPEVKRKRESRDSFSGSPKRDVPPGFEEVQKEDKEGEKQKESGPPKSSSGGAGGKPEPDPNGKTLDLSK